MRHPGRYRAALAGLLLTGLLGVRVVAAADAEVVRRLAQLVSATGEEYREALDDAGKVVRPIEIEEAKLLMSEARQLGPRLDAALVDELGRRLDAIARGIETTAPLERVLADVDGCVAWLAQATGVSVEIMPPAPPSPERGRVVYAEHCIGCHGETGRGDGPTAATLEKPPADFTDPAFMHGETPLDFLHIISVGKRLGGMPAWGEVLTPQQRWDAVSYIWTLRATPERLAEGRGLFVAHCAGCHGTAGDGRGQLAGALGAPLPDLTALGKLASVTDGELLAATVDGVAGTSMPGFARVLDDVQREAVVAFARSLSLMPAVVATPPAGTDAAGAPGDAGEALAASATLVGQAVEAYRAGDARARELATDAYFRFEPVERRLAGSDPSAVLRVEEAFLALRGALASSDAAAVEAAAERVRGSLRQAEAALVPSTGGWPLLVQSTAIIFREGFEIVLVVGALLAWVTRAGNPAMRRPIYAGCALGVLASGLTAVVLLTMFRLNPGAAELLEGIAMLLASAVLFWVSYWIISKAEADRWQRFIRGKVERALATGSGRSLAAASFLAVYREGFETILFYQALLASAPSGRVVVVSGIAVGALLLVVVYSGFRYLGLRLPIRQFFLGTGALLCLMSVVFAGKGIRELQEAGILGVTLVSGAPTVDALGVYPTLETLAAQGVLLVAIAIGLVVAMRPPRERLTSGQDHAA